MPNWKKLIVSGSDASLNSIAVNTTGSFDRVEANTIDLDRLSLTSTQTTVPPLQLTANSLNDGVGALRIDGSQADIFLNPSTATHTTVTFAVNNDQRLAFGMDNASDFYITRRTGGSWYDDTLVIDRDTGLLSLGYGLEVTGGVTGSSFTGSFFGDGSNLTGIVATSADSASVADRATTLSPDATASYADSATTASHALTAITASHTAGTASIANNAVTASFATLAGTIRSGLTASFADRATSASIADTLSQLATASFAVTASHALNGGSGGTSVGYSNLQTLSVDYTTEDDSYNSLYGPLTIADGVTVTVTAGSFLKIEDF